MQSTRESEYLQNLTTDNTKELVSNLLIKDLIKKLLENLFKETQNNTILITELSLIFFTLIVLIVRYVNSKLKKNDLRKQNDFNSLCRPSEQPKN